MTDRLREAAQAALEAIQELEYSSTTAVAAAKARRAKQLLRAALSEQDAEPVAWMSWADGEGVGYWATVGEANLHCSGDTEPVPLYTHPPRREWVGLTDEEMHLFASWLDEKPDAEVFAAIEAALKEKNHE